MHHVPWRCMYRERFPNRRHPRNARVITNAVQRLRDNRALVPGHQYEANQYLNVSPQLERRILRYPTSSTRKAGRIFGVNNRTIIKVMRRRKRHPFRFLKVHGLLPRDLPIRTRVLSMVFKHGTMKITVFCVISSGFSHDATQRGSRNRSQ